MIKIHKNQHILKMSQNNPIASRCQSGDTVVFETLDCFSNMLLPEGAVFGADNPRFSNPATGPLYVEGAEVGDTLKVEIMDITLGELGIFISGPINAIFDQTLESFHLSRIKVSEGDVYLSPDVKVKSKPMVGVIGVATVDDIPTALPGVHGGNLDCGDITVGSTIYLPVQVAGALLAIGDLHALMGDGEIGEGGLEIEGTVTVRVSVIKDMTLTTPRIETETFIELIGLGNTLELACEHASKEMLKYLMTTYEVDGHEAAKILCLCGHLKICQIVNQIKTVTMRLEREFINPNGKSILNPNFHEMPQL